MPKPCLAPALRASVWRALRASVWCALLVVALAGPAPARDRNATGWRLLAPCENNCAAAVFAGPFVGNSMSDVLYKDPEPPFTWNYRDDDWLLGLAVSRYAGTIVGRIDIEPEIGIARRIGRQDETEIWATLYARYRGFPWDETVTTSAAISTGFSYASDVSDVEASRAGAGKGDRLLHYFSPEITFALPSRPSVELIFRFHHRSGVFGIVSESRGGAHYGTVGLRYRF